MKKIVYLLILVSFSFASPCMAARRARPQVVITSEPVGSNIFINGRYQGTTPRSFPLRTHQSHRIIVEKHGYGSQYVDLQSRRNNARNSNKNLRCGIFPVAGAALGAGGGLIMTGGITSGLAGILVVSTTGIGLAIGSGIGLIGLGANMLCNSNKTKFPKRVHFNLQKDSNYKHECKHRVL